VNRSVFDVALVYAVGGAGFAMRTFDVPLAPAVIGLILGPMAEQHFRRALAIGQGSMAIFLARPVSALLLTLAVLVAIATRWGRRRT
jgi:putative tricarboxylic transport membrane protein